MITTMQVRATGIEIGNDSPFPTSHYIDIALENGGRLRIDIATDSDALGEQEAATLRKRLNRLSRFDYQLRDIEREKELEDCHE